MVMVLEANSRSKSAPRYASALCKAAIASRAKCKPRFGSSTSVTAPLKTTLARRPSTLITSALGIGLAIFAS